ncbi:MAG: hypothetical protein HKM28_07240 [Flavobacteriaceae bacterium]|nr:hypothetical protein [Flavobacteriaceae bacterium]
MKRFILVILFVGTVSQLFAQNEISTSEENDFLNHNSSYITFDMVTPVYVVNPRYSVGYITSIHPEWKLGIDLGYGSDEISVESTDR